MDRFDKAAARLFNISRSTAREKIKSGGLLLNGRPASPDDKVSATDELSLGGDTRRNEEFIYIMLNKPAGIVSATEDRDCRTVLDILPDSLRRKGLFPAGRLDKDTEGFVLLTDDGAFAHRILSPKSHVPKTYRAVLDKPFDEEFLREEFSKGVDIGNGEFSSSAQLEILNPSGNPEIRLVIFEGMFHQVKRMFARYGLSVLYLRREAIGGLWLDGSLAPGEARRITPEELAKFL